MATILVTGGAGFIGSHLCEALLRTGHNVVALDNFDNYYDPANKRQNIQAAAAYEGFTLVEGDIRDEDALHRSLKQRIDIIVHLAARAGVRPSIQQPVLYADVNVRGSAALLEGCRRHGVMRIIFASSSSVYGNNAKVPFAETDNVDDPVSPYAATKKAGELLCHAYHHLYQMKITCLRLFTVYGPRQRPDLAIHKFVRLMEAGRPVPIYGDGSMMRDFTYIDDIVEGILRSIERKDEYRIYNIGESEPVSVNDLVRTLGEVMGREVQIEYQPRQPGDVERTFADITRAREELGYHPATDLRTGLIRFVEWFRRFGQEPAT